MPVRTAAAPEEGALRVLFRRLQPGVAGHHARLEADGGALAERVDSPDLRTVAVLWRDPSGALTCRFPYGGEASWRADADADAARVEYVFLEEEGCRVSAQVPRACPVVSRVVFRVEVDALPAFLETSAGRIELTSRDSAVPFDLPRDGRGALVSGDTPLVLRTPRGAFGFLVGVDPDGTLTAPEGMIRNW